MTRKVERKFAARNVTELMVDDGQQADRGRKTRLNDVNGLVRSCEISRKDREAAEEQTWLQRAVEPER